MRVPFRIFHVLVLAGSFGIAASAGCGGAAHVASDAHAGPKPAWPPAPDRARIVYVDSYTASPGKPSIGFFAALLDIVFGSRNRDLPTLKKPSAIAVDSAGNVYATDLADARVYRIPRDGTVWTPLSAESEKYLGAPVGLIVSGDTVIVADAQTGMLVFITTGGEFVRAVSPGLRRPSAIAASGKYLYVVDAVSSEIATFTRQGEFVRKFGARGAHADSLNTPTNLTADHDTLFVVDAMNFRVAVFTIAGQFVRAFGVQGDGAGTFSRPRGIAIDPDGHVFVVDGLQENVQIYARTGEFLLAFGESGGTDPGRFNLPAGVAISRDGRIYVSDSYNHRIQAFQYMP